MKKRLINLRVMFLGSLLAFSGNVSFGQSIVPLSVPVQEKCAASFLHDHMMQSDPAYATRMQAFEASLIANEATPKVPAQYRIPVVVHVLHKGEAVGTGTNVSEQAIRNAIKDLNDRYRKTTGTGGFGNGVDMGIEFALAVRDPNGNCTNGITRTNMSSYTNYMNAGVNSGSTGSGMSDAAVKNVIGWNRTKYYNIWLVSEIDNNNGGAGIQGYAYFASSHGNANDGAIILASNFTSGFSMTATHELGHALNLYHTFEGDGSGNTCPTQANGCGSGIGDCCGDIPRHKRSQSDCNVTGTNSCDNNSSNALFARNYMDYASDACVNMFTANQKTRAQAACASERASFFASSNLALVPPSAPMVAFQTSKSIICTGESVTFTDISACVPNTYLPETNWTGMTFSWTFTNGSTTLTSTVQNPTMTFTVPGAYTVTLTVTTPGGTGSHTESNFVILGGTQVSACTPTSTNAGAYGQTVSNVTFNTINHSSDTYTNTAYSNQSCNYNTIVQAGQSYPISIAANSVQYAENVEVYIDYNNNGVFTNPGELVYSGSVPAGGSSLNSLTLTGNVTIPSTAVTNTLLRMRVMGNAGTISAGNRTCSQAFFAGDVADYGVYIQAAGCTTAPAIGTQPAASAICAGSNTTFAVASTGATTYQWQVSTDGGTTWTNVSNGGVYSTATTGTLTITAATATMNNYRYRCITTNDCGNTNSSNVTLTVNATPSVASTTPGSRCGTGTVTLGATASAGTLSWYAAATGGSAIGTGTSFTTPSISATTTYYVGAASNGCASARTAVPATVNNNVSVTSNPSSNTICAGSSVTLTAAGASGYTWSGGQSGASITVSPTATTTYTVTGVTSCTATASVTITVNPVPNTTLGAFQNVCTYNPAFTLTGGSPAGGTYSGTGVSNGIFTPSVVGTGTTTITYSVTQNGCTKSATSPITVGACLGLEEQEQDNLLIVYPNPVEGWMTIEGENLHKYQQIELRDAAGRLVASWKVGESKMSLDLSGYASGQYTVKIAGAENQVVKKINIAR